MQNPFDPGYYTGQELQGAGFKSIGKNVVIAKNCTIIGLENIAIGDNVRIDGYSSFIAAGSGSMVIGSNIHIGGYGFYSAGSGIVLHDFVQVSQGVRVYTRSDDYSGNHLVGPTIPARYLDVDAGPVVLDKHVLLGSGTIVMPGVTIGVGTATGAQTFVDKTLEPWGIYVGAPARRVKDRSQRLLALEQQFLTDD